MTVAAAPFRLQRALGAQRVQSVKLISIGSVVFACAAFGCSDDETTTDPGPTLLDCTAVDSGQTLVGAAALRAGGDLDISIDTTVGTFSQAPTVSNESGGTVDEVVVNMGTVQIAVTFDGGSSFTFDMDGRITGDRGDSCPTSRSFTVSISGSEATVN